MKKTLLFAFGMATAAVTNAQSNGTELFDDSYVHRIDITFQQTNFWDSLGFYYNDAFMNGGDVKYMQASVVVDGTEVPTVGVKQKGFYSNWGAGASLKKPLKIDFAEYIDQKYDGLKKVNLSNGFEDPAMMRDALAYKFMRDAGIHVPRTAYVRLFLNGTYWGLYLMVEEIDKRALKNWFDDNDGNLYKCINNTHLMWNGSTYENYLSEFELQTNEDVNDWTGFLNFVDDINNSGPQFSENIQQSLNMDNYLNVLAADVIMFNWDSYYNHGRNFFLYENPSTQKIEWIPWDYNLSFSATPTPLIIDYSTWGTIPKPLVQNLQDNPALRSAYFDHVCVLMDNYFTEDNLESFIDATRLKIRPDLIADNNKFFTTNQFDNSIIHDIMVTDQDGFQWQYKGLKQFINERGETIQNELNAYNHSCTGLGIDESGELKAVLYPNPFEENFTVKAPQQIERIEVYSSFGQLVKKVYPNQAEAVVSLGECAMGTYLVRVFSSDSVETFTVSKAK
jgi:hypothetical protein